jgi:hypothetical protein
MRLGQTRLLSTIGFLQLMPKRLMHGISALARKSFKAM